MPLNKFTGFHHKAAISCFLYHLERTAVCYFIYLIFINSQQISQTTLIGILACYITNLQKVKKAQWKTGGPNFTHHNGTQLKLRRKQNKTKLRKADTIFSQVYFLC